MKKEFLVIGIEWDCDDFESLEQLPTEVEIEALSKDEVVDALSDKFGWTINGVEDIIEKGTLDNVDYGNVEGFIMTQMEVDIDSGVFEPLSELIKNLWENEDNREILFSFLRDENQHNLLYGKGFVI